MVLSMTGAEREHVTFVGDRLYTDIATGVNAGILSVCVLTGESSAEDVENSSVKPDILVERLYSINGLLGLE